MLTGESFVGSKSKADCVVVAFANYFHKDYYEVLADLMVNRTSVRESPYKKGFVVSTYLKVMEKYLGRKPVEKHPRRGQDNIFGLVRLAIAGAKNGHMVIVMAGLVYDYSCPNGMPFKEYKERYKYTVKGVWF